MTQEWTKCHELREIINKMAFELELCSHITTKIKHGEEKEKGRRIRIRNRTEGLIYLLTELR